MILFARQVRLHHLPVPRLTPVFGIGFVAAIVLLLHLNDRDLWASHEARAAQNGRYILEHGPLGVSRLADGTPEYQKPPLYYWLVAAAGWLRGDVDAVATRLPAAIAGWLTVVMVTGFLQRRGRPQAAWLAGVVLLSTHHFLNISRTARIDVPLCCAITGTVLSGWDGRRFASGLWIAAGLLFKGPIGLVLPAGVLVLTGGPWIVAVTSGIALAAPWFVAAGPEFATTFFWYHNFQRAAGTATELARHPIWFYPVRLVLGTAPWSILACTLPFVRRPPASADEWQIERRALIWLGVVVGILSLSQFKRADYLIPAYPAFAILIGCWCERARLHRWVVALGACSLLGFGIWEFAFLPCSDAKWEQRTVAMRLQDVIPADEQVVFFRVEDHLLAHHLRRPLTTVREWENLNIWASEPKTVWVIMDTGHAALWPEHLTAGKLIPVLQLPARADRSRPQTRILLKSTHDVTPRDPG
jgi:4-amino-4-deoxy-L-arabinose transferase-like glycosyltransferase